MHRFVGVTLLGLLLTSTLGCALYTRVEGDFLEVEGVPIHYTLTGQGAPLVLIHGFAMDQDLEWRSDGFIDDGFAEADRAFKLRFWRTSE